MEKSIIYFMLMVFCFIPMIVAEETKDNEEPTENVKATELKDKIKDFNNAKSSDLTTEQKDHLTNEVNDCLADMPIEDARDNFNPTDYMKGVSNKFDTMMNEIKDPKYKEKGSCKEDYIRDITEQFIAEYAKDLNNGAENITTQQYLDDYDTIFNDYKKRLENLNNEGAQSEAHEYVPEDFLDKSPFGKKAEAGKIDLSWAGVDDHWLGQSLLNIIATLRDKFSDDAKAKADLNWMYQVWSWKNAEVKDMSLSYKNNYSGDDHVGKQTGAYKNNFYIDAYGKMITDDSQKNQYDQNEFTTTQSPLTKLDGTYNNRSYGRRYNDGTSTTIKITTGHREYALQESLYTSPIILDMNGDDRIEASDGQWLPHREPSGSFVEFDIDGDGFVDLTEWVGPNDGILLDTNSTNLTIQNFFGSTYGFYHGYEKLSLLDKNNDTILSKEELKGLYVWQDKNTDAKVDNGEILSLEELGITSINLNHDQVFVSSFEQNGVSKKMWDWFPSMMRVQRKK